MHNELKMSFLFPQAWAGAGSKLMGFALRTIEAGHYVIGFVRISPNRDHLFPNWTI